MLVTSPHECAYYEAALQFVPLSLLYRQKVGITRVQMDHHIASSSFIGLVPSLNDLIKEVKP